MSPLLEVKDLTFAYGEALVLRGLSFGVAEKEIVCLMGRNGVGKTTLLRNLVGLEKPSSGEVRFGGREVTASPAHARAGMGFGYVPQGRQIFPRLTVEENLKIGLEAAGSGVRSIPEEVFDTFPVLWEMKRRRGGDLSGGQQQQLAIGRALVTQPKLLVLDEPTEGIQPNVIQRIGEVVRELVEKKGLSVLLVEQYVDFVRGLADRFYVMNRGEFVAEGAASELDDDLVYRHLTV